MCGHRTEWQSGSERLSALSLQTHQFFLEHDSGGDWHWYWWLKVPGQGSSAAGNMTQVAVVGGDATAALTQQPPQNRQPGSRPSSRSVWSAVTQVAFGEALACRYGFHAVLPLAPARLLHTPTALRACWAAIRILMPLCESGRAADSRVHM